jgi:uncharacterized membrane protein YcaP (DUF421 family)
MTGDVFFHNWHDLLRILLVGLFAYPALIFMLRVTGKRTLSKMSAFDMIVTIALGSALSSTILDSSVSLAEGLAALSLLIALQVTVSWLSVRWKAVRELVHAEPTLLLHQGSFCWEAMREARVTEKEIRQALREQGVDGPEQASAVVLETNGKLSVVSR